MKFKSIWLLLGSLCLVSCSRSDKVAIFLEHQNAGDKAYVEHNYPEAEKQYKAALAVAEEKEAEKTLVIISLRSLAQLYIAQKKSAEPEALLQRRVAIAEKVKFENTEDLAAIYDDLASFYLLRDRYSEAEPLYQQALTIREKAFGVNSPKVAESLEYYALLLRRINRNEEAAQLEARAATIKIK